MATAPCVQVSELEELFEGLKRDVESLLLQVGLPCLV